MLAMNKLLLIFILSIILNNGFSLSNQENYVKIGASFANLAKTLIINGHDAIGSRMFFVRIPLNGGKQSCGGALIGISLFFLN